MKLAAWFAFVALLSGAFVLALNLQPGPAVARIAVDTAHQRGPYCARAD